MAPQATYASLGGTVAENYERYFVPVIPAPLATDLLETAALVPGEHVLDVACGTGVVTRLAAERVGPGGRVVGVDATPAMLDVARSLPAPAGAPVEWQEASAESLPLPDESFDVVLSQLGLMFVPDKAAAVGEMRRVLSPGGRVAINVPGEITEVFAIFDEALARHVSPDLAGFVRVVFSLHDPAVVGGLLRQAGFEDVAVEVVTKTLPLVAPADFARQYVLATPMAAVLPPDDPRWEGLEAELVERWQPFVEDGRLVIHQPIVTATGTAA